MHSIYALLDEHGEVYYIGKSKKPKGRLQKHDSDAANGNTRIIAYHKLRKLHKIGVKAITHHKILECGIGEEEIDLKETDYIKKFRKIRGKNLLNVTTGGEGGKGFTAETVAKVAAANLGKKRSDSSRIKISIGKANKPLSNQHKKNLKKAWITRKEIKNMETCKENRKKASIGKINLGMYEMLGPQGQTEYTPNGISEFCRENKLSGTNLLKRGKQGGWSVVKKIGTNPIIKSLLSTDLYKLTMGQVVWKKFPDTIVEYTYHCRSEIDLSGIADEIERQIEMLCEMKFSTSELEWLATLPYMEPAFVRALTRFQLNKAQITITKAPFTLTIKGLWFETIFFEVMLLSIISEAHYKKTITPTRNKTLLKLADKKLTEKIEEIKKFLAEGNLAFRLIEFGTRRRYSAEWQEHVLQRLLAEVPTAIFGTSNANLARKYNLRAVGTMAHEYLQAFQAFGRISDSQKAALQTWADVYRGDLGIALTDVISMDAFLKDFDLYFAKLFDGLRHDSGCPKVWAKKAITHYENFGIDPSTKALVFSDGLNIPKAIELCREFEPFIKTSFGIGTNLTCDIPGVPALNHVLKMTHCQGQPVAKLSDSPGKSMCKDTGYLTYLKQVFDYQH